MKSPVDANKCPANAVIHRCPECDRPVYVELREHEGMTWTGWLSLFLTAAGLVLLGMVLG